MSNPEIVNHNPQDPRAELIRFSEGLSNLSVDEMIKLIAVDLLNIEDENCRNGNHLTADYKILFLIGDDTKDVTRSKGLDGKDIYTNKRDFPRPPEIIELTSAISRYDDEDRKNIGPVLSETADIIYNVAQLTELDSEFKAEYTKWLYYFSKGIGMDLKELLGLAVIKYRRRYSPGNEKNVKEEEAFLVECLRGGAAEDIFSVQRPSDEGLIKISRIVNLFGSTVLSARLNQLDANLRAETEIEEIL